MPEVPELYVRPPARCYGRPKDRLGRVCGRRAYWMRDSKHGAEPATFCDKCKGPYDVPIAADALFRRVTVTLDIELAACSLVPGAAQTEAVAVVEELVRQAGGLLNLRHVSSVVGRPASQARPQPARPVPERV